MYFLIKYFEKKGVGQKNTSWPQYNQQICEYFVILKVVQSCTNFTKHPWTFDMDNQSLKWGNILCQSKYLMRTMNPYNSYHLYYPYYPLRTTSPWRGRIFSAMQNILKKRISTTLRWLTSMWRKGKSQRESSRLSSYFIL